MDQTSFTSSSKPFLDITVRVDGYAMKYKELLKIGEGSYSTVMKCRNRDGSTEVAVKKLKHCYRNKVQVEDIPEIKALRKLPPHPNILQMTEAHFDPHSGRVCLVFELMEMNLYELIKDRKKLLGENRVRAMIFQLMRALRHLHKFGVFHRDIKPENILIQTKPGEDLLKLADLGSVRAVYSRPPYTEYISTRWYRSPECLLTSGRYNVKMDVWAAGCVFYEILTLRPLFPGSSELDQITKIHALLGHPSERVLQKLLNWANQEGESSIGSIRKRSRFEAIKDLLCGMENSKSRRIDNSSLNKQSPFAKILPSHISKEAHELLKLMLLYDPDSRPSSHRVLQHNYFKNLRAKVIVKDRTGPQQLPLPQPPNLIKLHMTTPGDSFVTEEKVLQRTSKIMGVENDDKTASTSSSKPFLDITVRVDGYAMKYKELLKIGEGSYSTVMKCRNRDGSTEVAVKKLKHCYRNKVQVEDIPEIKALRKLPPHPNILQMTEAHFDPQSGRVCLVFELMEMNLYELIKDRKRLLDENRVRAMIFQLMRGLRHLHKFGVFHRDIKPENILIQTKPGEDLLKLADLGSVRAVYSRPPYTEYISTRWYRSPECLLTSGRYNVKMDVWAAGCVFYEILTLRPLFPGSSELDQITKIHALLGHPSERVLQKLLNCKDLLCGMENSKTRRIDNSSLNKQSPFAKILPSHISKEAHELLKLMLLYDPDSRPSSHRVLQHNYFKNLRAKVIVKDRTGPQQLPLPQPPNLIKLHMTTPGDSFVAEEKVLQRTSKILGVENEDQFARSVNLVKQPKPVVKIAKKLLDPPMPTGSTLFPRPTEQTRRHKIAHNKFGDASVNSFIKDQNSNILGNMFDVKPEKTKLLLPFERIYLNSGDQCNSYKFANISSSPIKNKLPTKAFEMKLEKKPSIISLTREKVFMKKLVDNSRLNSLAVGRINEARRVVRLGPITNSSTHPSKFVGISGFSQSQNVIMKGQNLKTRLNKIEEISRKQTSNGYVKFDFKPPFK